MMNTTFCMVVAALVLFIGGTPSVLAQTTGSQPTGHVTLDYPHGKYVRMERSLPPRDNYSGASLLTGVICTDCVFRPSQLDP